MPVSGSLVWVRPRLKKEPPSLGQVNSAGSWSRSTSSPLQDDLLDGRAVRLHLLRRDVRHRAELAERLAHARRSPCGSSGLSSPPIFSLISPYDFSPSAFSRRRSVPKTFIARGIAEPFTFSKSRAGPPALLHPVDDLPDLQVRVDLGLDALEVALALQCPEQGAKIVVSHAGQVSPRRYPDPVTGPRARPAVVAGGRSPARHRFRGPFHAQGVAVPRAAGADDLRVHRLPQHPGGRGQAPAQDRLGHHHPALPDRRPDRLARRRQAAHAPGGGRTSSSGTAATARSGSPPTTTPSS